MKRQYRPLTSQSGFTLIELAVVILLIGGIVALAANNIVGAKNKSNYKLAQTQLNLLRKKGVCLYRYTTIWMACKYG